MNFIVGALLYHANEVMAFWLFVSLIEDCEMRDIYMNGLPGLFKHSHIISSLISTNMFELAEHFVSISIPYIFSRLSTTLKLKCMHLIGFLASLHQWFLLSKWAHFSLSSLRTNGSSSTSSYSQFWRPCKRNSFKKMNFGTSLTKLRVKPSKILPQWDQQDSPLGVRETKSIYNNPPHLLLKLTIMQFIHLVNKHQ